MKKQTSEAGLSPIDPHILESLVEARPDWSHKQTRPGKMPANRGVSSRGEQREFHRTSQRDLGRVAVSLRLPGGDWAPVQLWDFTSIGFGIYCAGGSTAAAALAPPEYTPGLPPQNSEPAGSSAQVASPSIEEGDEVELCIQVRAGQEFQVWCQARNISPWRGGLKVGLRRLDVNFPQPVDVERRESFRLPMAPALSLKARIKHPYLFGHWCPLQVSDVNRNLGLSFQSQDDSILLFEGMEVQVHFELASLRQTPMTGRVAWVHATEANKVRFGVACLDMDYRLHNGICDYLLFSRHWTPARLRDGGFKALQVKNCLRFRAVKDMEDYGQILHLRRDAYVGAGKKPEGTIPEEMSTPLDGKSRILMAHHGDRLVGTVTFTFPTSEDTLLDSQAGFPGQKYPVHLPPKANLIEVSRLCIHEEYRSTDLLQGIFEHGLKHFLMSDRHWLLTSAVDDLLPLYQRIGFVKLKASYKHPQLNNQEHHLIIAHRSAFLWGFGINLLLWNHVFGGLVLYLLERKLVVVPRWTRAIIHCKLLFRPLAERLLDASARRAFRKHMRLLRQGKA